jgi:hypothetical protein
MRKLQLLIVNNWNVITLNFVEVTNRGAYLYFMGKSASQPVNLTLARSHTNCAWLWDMRSGVDNMRQALCTK